jgi:molybdate/tungstate transport system substrate-binding protein
VDKFVNLRKWLSLTLVLFIAASAAGCSFPGGKRETGKTRVKVIMAGSLLVPFQALEKQFESKNPDIDLLLDGHGSVQVIRSVTELGNVADLTVVADAQLIPLMMYSAQMPDSNKPYADWSMKFSTNRLGIAYNDQSAYAAEINADNWYQVLSRPDVSVGLAEPRIDAMGYRTLMVIQLAENYYRDNTIFEKTIGVAFNPAMVITEKSGVNTITVPDVVKSTQSRVKLRSYSIQLMALLESGDLDYSFEYESVAKQRGLKFLALPELIDLSSPGNEKDYQKVEVNLDFKRFASLIPNFKGTQIVYGLTIPGNAPHSEEAARFVNFMLSPEGRHIFEESSQSLLPEPGCDNIQAMPPALQRLF